jgi:hypothetical protein
LDGRRVAWGPLVNPNQLLEIREEFASPETSALYADIKSVMRVPFVNLVHRYLATIPGALPYAWSIVRAPMLDGRMDRWVDAMLGEASWPRIGPRAAAIREALPDAAQTRAALANVNTYNRGNPRNVITFGAIAGFMADPTIALASEDPPAEWGPPDPPAPMPPLARYADLPPELQQAIADLATREHIERDGIVPSLFLHLAAWPKLLIAVRDALVPVLAGGAMGGRARSASGATEPADSARRGGAASERREDPVRFRRCGDAADGRVRPPDRRGDRGGRGLDVVRRVDRDEGLDENETRKDRDEG